MIHALTWWGDELGSLLPRPLRRFFGGERRQVVLAPGAPPEGIEEDAELILRLPAERALARTLRLPASADGSALPGALAFELERQTPFRAEEVWLGWRRESASGPELSIRLVVARREDVAAALRDLADRGLTPEAVEVEGEPGVRLAIPNLARRRRGVGSLNGGLFVLLAILILAAFAAPAWLADREADRLEAEIAALRPAVERTLELRAEVDRLLGGAERVVRAKGEAPLVTKLLEEMTRALPDDAWLGQFNVAEGKVEIEGVAASAAALVRAIEASPLFGAVQYRAPVSADPVTRLEHFQFAVDLERP